MMSPIRYITPSERAEQLAALCERFARQFAQLTTAPVLIPAVEQEERYDPAHPRNTK